MSPFCENNVIGKKGQKNNGDIVSHKLARNGLAPCFN